jgi:hypothetical protein
MYQQTWLTSLLHLLSNTVTIHRIKKKNPKIHVEAPKTENIQNTSEQKEQY